jgi:pimeloyl-ACP methyl ester carboxylesterase
MQKVKINGAELRYEVTGSGEPVLLISLGPIADSFRPFVAEQPLTRYRLIRYEQRRSGPGEERATPVSFAEHAADAAALLDHLGVRRAHVAGHSSGAAIALQLAFEYPGIVHSLVLLEPPLMSAPSAGAFLEKAKPALAAYGSGDHEGAMAGFMSVACSLDWETCQAHVEKHVPGGVALALKNADNFFGGYLPALGAWQFGPAESAAISQPVLSVWGTDTEQWFADGQDLLRAWFPQLEDCTIEGVAHLLHLQHPEPVARGVVEFLARHPL